MKVRIITERELPDADLDHWIRKCISIGIPLDGNKLKKDGYFDFDCDNGYTKAHTRYELIKDAPQDIVEAGDTAHNISMVGEAPQIGEAPTSPC